MSRATGTGAGTATATGAATGTGAARATATGAATATGTATVALAIWILGACKAAPVATVDASTDAQTTLQAADSSVSTWQLAKVDGCELRFADDPARESAAVSWGPCARGPTTGCREVSVALPGALSPLSLRAEAAYSNVGTISMLRATPLAHNLERYFLGPPDGPANVVIETNCAGHALYSAVGDDSAMIGVDKTFFTGPFANTFGWRIPSGTLGPELGEVIMSSSIAITSRSIRSVDARSRVLRTDATAPPFRAHDARPIFLSSLDGVVARQAVTVFVAESIPEKFGIQIGALPPETWYTAAAGEGLSAPARDGDQIVWLHGKGRDDNNHFTSIDVFSAAFPLSSAPPVRRKIGTTKLRTMTDPIAGAGHVAYKSWLDADHSVVLVLDGASGRTVQFTPPHDRTLGRLVWVNDQEVAIEIVDANRRTMSALLWRINLASLPLGP